jgi:endoglucanase
MGFDRRTLLIGMGLTLATACARAEKRGENRTEKQSGSRSARPIEKRRETAVTGGVDWPSFKASFLDPSGRVVDNGNGGVSHSEGQSYGLLLAVWNDDQPIFDTIWKWTESTLAHQDMALFSWRYDPRAAIPVNDPNNATDGDIAIAWALAQASHKWRNPAYAQRSSAIRGAIRSKLVIERFGRQLLLPGLNGFNSEPNATLNPSYYLWPALDAFRDLDGDAAWGKIIGDGEALMEKARFGPLALPTDWIDVTGHDSVMPAAGRPARFGFDAIRVPLYAQAGRRTELVAPIRQYWQGYTGNHQPIPAWVDVQSGEVAPYALSAGGAAIAANILGGSAPDRLSTDYFAASLQMLAAHLK